MKRPYIKVLFNWWEGSGGASFKRTGAQTGDERERERERGRERGGRGGGDTYRPTQKTHISERQPQGKILIFDKITKQEVL